MSRHFDILIKIAAADGAVTSLVTEDRELARAQHVAACADVANGEVLLLTTRNAPVTRQSPATLATIAATPASN